MKKLFSNVAEAEELEEVLLAVKEERYIATQWELFFCGSVASRIRAKKQLTGPMVHSLEGLLRKVRACQK